MEKLVLIDGNSLINRAFYAMPVLSTAKGEFTNAVYGFLNMFFKMVDDEKPSHIAVAFDLKASTFRHKLYPEYKGTRKPMPEELRPQIPLLKEVLTLMGVCVLQKEGVEADDIIGTVAKHTDLKTIIITGDKDSFQLVDDTTEVHFTRRGISDIDIYNHLNFTEKTGINPIQIIDLKSLMGDSSDNIPGVSGVGEKTATTLVQTYSSLEKVYENVGEIKGKLQEKLIASKETAFLSKTLATINQDCGIEFSLDDMAFSMPLDRSVKQKFIELEFKSIYKREELFSFEDAQTQIEKQEDSAFAIKEINDVADFNYERVNGISIYFSTQKICVFDQKTEYVFKISQNLLDTGLPLSVVLTALKPVLNGENSLILFSKKDVRHFIDKALSLSLTAPCDDLSILKYLVDFSGKDLTADEVILEYGQSLETPAQSISKIFNDLKDKLDDKLLSLYRDVELPLADVLFDMEKDGFKIDIVALQETGKAYKQTLLSLESQIRELAGEPNLNINSPRQLGEVIFDKLKLAKGKKTKTGYSTTAEVLEAIEHTHPVIPLILQYRRLQKLLSTYVEGFIPLVDKNTGLIHTSFNQTVTATGRLSSKEPNLQNIPVRDSEGRELRKFFVPRDNEHVLVGADYSQIELRLLAAFSLCPALVDAYKTGKDIHATTAAKVFKVKLEDVTSEMRSKAKAVNFGIIYGISEYGLAKQLKISPAEAREYISAYFKEYPEVKKYMDDNVEFAKANGYAVTLLGRKRYIKELFSPTYMMRQFGERVAMNMPLQGSSADIIKLAMIGVSRALKKNNLKSKLILQVHDELIIDTLKSEQKQVEEILINEMQSAVSLPVELTASLGSGNTWFEAK